MAFTYRWTDAIGLLRSYARNIPVDKVDATICDAVSSELWAMYPWRETTQNIPPTSLLNLVQDYDSPPTFYKLVFAQIVRTLPQSDTYEPLHIMTRLPEMSVPAPPIDIKMISAEPGVGLLRLSFPAYVNTNEAFELHGEYQLQHTRVTDTDSFLWTPDQLWMVIQEGLLYWGYKLANMSEQKVIAQYQAFRQKATEAWQNERQGSGDVLIPEVDFTGMIGFGR